MASSNKTVRRIKSMIAKGLGMEFTKDHQGLIADLATKIYKYTQLIYKRKAKKH